MEEGINLSVVMSGATLIGIIGLLVRVWIAGRAQKIEQPLDIQPSACERQIFANHEEHSNIFARLSCSEQRLSALESSVGHVDRRLQSMDSKLDRLLIKDHRNEA